MKILLSRRRYLIKYLCLIPALFMLINLKSNSVNLSASNEHLENEVIRLENKTDMLVQRVKKDEELLKTEAIEIKKTFRKNRVREGELNLRKLIEDSNRVASIRNRHFIQELFDNANITR